MRKGGVRDAHAGVRIDGLLAGHVADDVLPVAALVAVQAHRHVPVGPSVVLELRPERHPAARHHRVRVVNPVRELPLAGDVDKPRVHYLVVCPRSEEVIFETSVRPDPVVVRQAEGEGRLSPSQRDHDPVRAGVLLREPVGAVLLVYVVVGPWGVVVERAVGIVPAVVHGAGGVMDAGVLPACHHGGDVHHPDRSRIGPPCHHRAPVGQAAVPVAGRQLPPPLVQSSLLREGHGGRVERHPGEGAVEGVAYPVVQVVAGDGHRDRSLGRYDVG